MPKVSVIIPVYNVEKYLYKCLDSVIKQTLSDIEIICVDDGSTDSCPAILDEYAARDSRIIVIHKQNDGYGQTMNVGMDAASGEYIGIVESDDWILPDMYEQLYSTATQNNLDFVRSDFIYVWESLDYTQYGNILFNDKFYNKLMLKDNKAFAFESGTPNWTGIYKTEFIRKNNIRHNETSGASYQDTGFRNQVMMFYERALWINKAFYMYRQDNPAASMKSKGKMMALSNEYDFTENILRSNNMCDKIGIINYLRMCGHIFTFARIDDSLKPEFAEYIKADYEKRRDTISDYGFVNYKYTMDFIEALCENPKSVCEKAVQRNRYLKNLINEYDEIIIYGAGKRAENVCIDLYNRSLFDKIKCIAVSKKTDKNTFMTLPLYEIDQVSADKNSRILIAVKKDTPSYYEIIKTLNSLGLTNYTDTEGLVQ